jgi:hypothetical protein
VWNFLSGFFGLNWEDKATVGYGIEGFSTTDRWNNSLAGYDNCPNSNNIQNHGGSNAMNEWVEIYLQNTTDRINKLIDGLDFSVQDVYAMQTMCPYEYVSSKSCNLPGRRLRTNSSLGRVCLQPILPAVHIRRMGELRVQYRSLFLGWLILS